MNTLHKICKRVALSLLLGCGAVGFMPLAAQTTTVATDTIADTASDEMTMEQALAEPEVPAKLNTFIKSYMKREALALQKAGYKVETMRKGEIVIATIPTDKLFAPNDTVLMKSAESLLKPFLPYFKVPNKFKVILAVHTDDTGSEDYLNALCEKRIIALYDYFDTHASNTDSLIGYPIATNEPLNENNSRNNRAENRRLEIFIVPSTVLIEDSKPSK